MNHHIKLKRHCWRALAAVCLVLTSMAAMAQAPTANPNYVVVERGADFRVWQRAIPTTNSLTGEVTQQLNAYRELGNGLCYQTADGSWSDSQDLVEVTSNGAQAVRGPMPAYFNSDITAASAISLLPPASAAAVTPIQWHPIGLFYYDATLDKVARIGSIQAGQAVLHPPNVIVYQDVINDLADLMVVWTKAGCEESLVIKRSPPPPQSFGLTSAARLQYWSAIDCPDPKEQRPVLLPSGLTDHIIVFDSCWMPVGGVFTFGDAPLPAPDKPAEIRLTDPSDPKSVCLAKTLMTIAGQKVLIAEVNYTDVIPTLTTLPQASWAPKPDKAVELANRGDLITVPQAQKPSFGSIPVASTPYRVNGLILDPPILLSGSANNYTFNGSTTYYIQSSYYIGPGMATFMNSAIIKFDPNALLLVYGPVWFPSYGQPVIFTSKDDNSCGEVVGGTNPSTSEPSYAAAQEALDVLSDIQYARAECAVPLGPARHSVRPKFRPLLQSVAGVLCFPKLPGRCVPEHWQRHAKHHSRHLLQRRDAALIPFRIAHRIPLA